MSQFIRSSPYISAELAEELIPTSFLTGISMDLHRRYNDVTTTGTKKVVSPGAGTAGGGVVVVGEEEAAM